MGGYRARLSIAMMLIVAVLTGIGLFLAERKVNIESRRDLLQDFKNELATLDRVREIRQTALAERCQTLVGRPRIHAALEDNAVDLLYPSAKDELRDILGEASGTGEGTLKAKFYRFLDGKGSVIVPPEGADVGPALSRRRETPGAPSPNERAAGGLFATRGCRRHLIDG